MYKFIKLKDINNKFDISEIEMTVDADAYTEILEEFEFFLKACGFHFNGHLEITEKECTN